MLPVLLIMSAFIVIVFVLIVSMDVTSHKLVTEKVIKEQQENRVKRQMDYLLSTFMGGQIPLEFTLPRHVILDDVNLTYFIREVDPIPWTLFLET